MKNERDRLIDLLKTGGVNSCDDFPECSGCLYENDEDGCIDKLIADTADHLIANGVIVPPCKVGDTVWLLQKRCKYAGDENKPWDSCRQYWDNVFKKGMWGCAGKDDAGNTFPCEKKELVWYAKEMEYSFALYSQNIVQGENLFLTREEAEQALKERSEKK